MLGLVAKANLHLAHSQPGEKNMDIKCCTLGTIFISVAIFCVTETDLSPYYISSVLDMSGHRLLHWKYSRSVGSTKCSLYNRAVL
jgi:hypothetical protein